MLEEIICYFNQIQQKYGEFSRLYKVFSTESKHYVYDVGTGKVLECNDSEFNLLTSLLSSYNINNTLKENIDQSYNLMIASREYNLFQAPLPTSFNRERDEIIQSAENELQQITLELTQKCNMACRYCIYGECNSDFREFSGEGMSWDIAKLGIDYAITHSSKKIAITFYGGEPLIEFDLLKQCVDYSLENKINKEITFSMTTNLTLITSEIACYLASIPNFSIVCSIDGPKNLHNKNRVFQNGQGTFDKAIEGLEILINAYKEKAGSLISLSMVITSLSSFSLNSIDYFFKNLSWLPEDINKSISYERISSDIEINAVKNSNKYIYSNPIGEWALKKILYSGENNNKLFTKNFIERHLLNIHNRVLTEEPFPYYSMNGCCLPASRRLYVTAGGDFHVCERIGKSPLVGNVNEGLDKDTLIKKYLFEYTRQSISKCSKCWAIRFCMSCYVDCYDSNDFRIELKEISCVRTRAMVENDLIDYHIVLENKPDTLNELNNIVLS